MLRRVPRWYWALIALWACALIAALVIFGGWRAVVYLTMVLLTANPLLGVPALIALLSPVLAFPIALKRQMNPQGA